MSPTGTPRGTASSIAADIVPSGQEGPAGEAELVREASTGGVDHAQPAFRGGGWPGIGTPVSGQRRPVSVSFRPAGRVWRGFLSPAVRVSREVFESRIIVSDVHISGFAGVVDFCTSSPNMCEKSYITKTIDYLYMLLARVYTVA